MSNQLTGRIWLTLNGQRIESLPGAVIDLGGVSRAGKAGERGVAGFTETVAIPRLEFTIPHKAGVKVTDIHALKNVPVVAESDTGTGSWLFDQAWSAETPKINSNGDVRCVFEAMRTREL